VNSAKRIFCEAAEQAGKQAPAVRLGRCQGVPFAGDAKTERQKAVAQLRGVRDKVNGSGKDVPRGTSFCDDRILCTAKSIDKANTSRTRQQVISRDGQQCATPGCQNQGELYAHHVVWRSEGGRTNMINEVSVCQTCHSLVHDGLLNVSGEAPLGLSWLDSNGKALKSADRTDPCAPLRYRRVVREDVPRGTSHGAGSGPGPGGAGMEEKAVIYSLDEIPNRVDSAWWQKHKHCFTSRGGRIFLSPQA